MSDKRVLVIGAGMGGLLLAQKLNQSRIPVTLFEKNAFAGGYNGQIRMGQTLVPLISYKALGLAPGTRLRALFEQCAPEAASRIQRMDFCDYLVFDDAKYQLPGDPVGFQKALQHAFPDQSAAITTFMETVHAIYKGLENAFGSNTQSERNASLKALASLPSGTFEEFLTESVTHPRLRAILSSRLFSSSNSLVTMAAYLGNMLWGGLYGVPCLSTLLTSSLSNCVCSNPQNELLLESEVAELLFDDAQQVCGAITRDGLVRKGQCAVLNCDLTKASESLVPPSTTRNLAASMMRGANPSLSALNVIFVLQPKFSNRISPYATSARIFRMRTDDVFQTFRGREAGKFDDTCFKINLDVVPNDNKEAGDLVCLYVEVDCSIGSIPAIDNPASQVSSERWLSALIVELDRMLPGFAEAILEYKVVSPEAFAALTGNRNGACSGWNDDSHRPAYPERHLGPANMFVVGQWSKFGTGLPMLEQGAHSVANRIASIMERQ